MTKKFFFMAQMRAVFQGRPQSEFNTVSGLDSRNVTAADLTRIQDAAAQMLNGQVQFDDIVITNLFFLAECTEAEFFAGTQVADAPAAEGLEEAVAQSLNDADPAPEAEAPAETEVEEGVATADVVELRPTPAPVEDDGDHSHDDRIA